MRFLLLTIIIFSPALCIGQVADSLPATYLTEVNVYGMPVTRHSAGAKIEYLQIGDADILLTDILNRSTSVYFKTYGNHQLSTIAFRGTSASHTAVLWNGVNINSPSLGQTDFSLLPVFLLDDIAVQYGTSSSLYGSDALGGSVLLNTSPPVFSKQLQLQLRQDVGSFGNFFSGIKMRLSDERWDVRTKLMHRSLENNFPFTSPAVGYRKIQQHSAVAQYGLNQQLSYKISEQGYLSLDFLYTNNFREIQPVVTNDNSDETLEDISTRISLSYQRTYITGHMYLACTYTDNFQAFSLFSPSRIKQFNVILNFDKQLLTNKDIRYGLSSTRVTADIANYQEGLTEDSHDIFFSLTQNFTQRWKTSFNLRQSLYERHLAPISPSIGTEYLWHKTESSTATIALQASRGYRIPTLNDRYWRPGGNLNLKPENAWHAESALVWNYNKNGQTISSSITGYQIWANEWILWLPSSQGFWSPANLQKVNAYGTEFQVSGVKQQGNFKIETTASYSFTRSRNVKGLTPGDAYTINSQLPYVPYHQASLLGACSIGTWSSGFSGAYTGLRYTTLDNMSYQSLPAYVLSEVWFAKKLSAHALAATVRMAIDNVFDIYYENMMNRAMPGRSYLLSIILNLNQNQ